MEQKTCCFLGHRKIEASAAFCAKLRKTIEGLITEEGLDTFYFGSKSEFDNLCLKVVTELKTQYSHIRRIYVRAEFPCINDDYKNYLLQQYDDTYYPEKLMGAGKAVYIRRNCEMIDKSRVCVVYYDENYTPSKKKGSGKSGTKIAYEYAIKKKKEIKNIFLI